MNTKVLIDAIIRQTTLLIAQLSTAAGIRAPLAHIADQVFLELAREIETQGVSRKVAADMFGLALRSYQKKVQRLTESTTERNVSLWEAVLTYLREEETATRARLFQRFHQDEPASVASILTDLVTSGLVYRTGSGDASLYGVTPEHAYRQVVAEQDAAAATAFVWQVVYRQPGLSGAELMAHLAIAEPVVAEALELLIGEGRIERRATADGDRYWAASFLVPVGAERGWEAAVLDHYQAVVAAIVTKLRSGRGRAEHADLVGGATISFDLTPDHPERAEVVGLLATIRAQLYELWERVEAHNREHPPAPERLTKLWFYLGQYMPLDIEDDGLPASLRLATSPRPPTPT